MITETKLRLFSCRLAGLNFHLHGLDDSLHERMRAIFGGFKSAGTAPVISIKIEIRGLPRRFYVSEFVTNELSVVRIDSKDLWGRINLKELYGQVIYAEEALADFEFNFGHFMAKFLSIWLARRDGLLLHGSGVIRDSRAYLFVGESGAGKTTIAKLIGSKVRLNEDRLTVSKTGDGCLLTNTPLWDHVGLEACAAPLGHIYFPVQSDTCAIKPLAPEAALRRYLAAQHSDMFWQLLGGHLQLAGSRRPSDKKRPRNIEFTYKMFGILSDIFRTTEASEFRFNLNGGEAERSFNEHVNSLSN